MARTVITSRDLVRPVVPSTSKDDSLQSDIDNAEFRQLAREKRTRIKDPGAVLDLLAQTPDDYKTRLLKYIPAEVIALYLTLDGLLRPTVAHPIPATKIFIYWLVFAFGLLVTPIYLWRVQNVRKNAQLGISTVAFAVWVYALGGPFQLMHNYDPLYGSILLPTYTFLIAIFEA